MNKAYGVWDGHVCSHSPFSNVLVIVTEKKEEWRYKPVATVEKQQVELFTLPPVIIDTTNTQANS